MFGLVNFREDGKKKKEGRENGGLNIFGECLVGKRGGKKKTKMFSPQNGEKTGWGF